MTIQNPLFFWCLAACSRACPLGRLLTGVAVVHAHSYCHFAGRVVRHVLVCLCLRARVRARVRVCVLVFFFYVNHGGHSAKVALHQMHGQMGHVGRCGVLGEY